MAKTKFGIVVGSSQRKLIIRGLWGPKRARDGVRILGVILAALLLMAEVAAASVADRRLDFGCCWTGQVAASGGGVRPHHTWNVRHN
jgi:hypothetical protein